jgi:methionine-rich copper-binding protein CopC
MFSRLRAAWGTAFALLMGLPATVEAGFCGSDVTNPPWAITALRLPQAWTKVCGSANVAVLDRGIQRSGSYFKDDWSGANAWEGNFRLHLSKDCTQNQLAGTDQNQCIPDGRPFINLLSGTPVQDTATVEERTLSASELIIGHGTHVAGIVGAARPPQEGVSFAGACRRCSVLIMTREGGVTGLDAITGLRAAYSSGAQVINLSAGTLPGGFGPMPTTLNADILEARKRDVIFVASSGNNGTGPGIDYPANNPGTLAIGGLQQAATPLGSQIWMTEAATPPFANSMGSSTGVEQYLVAPARTIHSAFYDLPTTLTPPRTVWRDFDNDALDCAGIGGFGTCSGTSMSAPYVAGLIGLIRSAQPTLTTAGVKGILQSTSTNPEWAGQRTTTYGWGVPNAEAAVTQALGGANIRNRTTPLFALNSVADSDHVFTVVPQVAMAAIEGTLPPKPNSQDITWPTISMGLYVPVGQSMLGYTSFAPACVPEYPGHPQQCSIPNWGTPRAAASVMTTHVNPLIGGPELLPIYRMSWRCDDGAPVGNRTKPSVCTSKPGHISHFYTTDKTEMKSRQALGYKVDAIEGFVYPPSQAVGTLPSSAVKLCRKYNATRDDYLLYAGTSTAATGCDNVPPAVAGEGPGFYVTETFGGIDFIGYAYPVGDPAPLAMTSTPTSIVVNSGSDQIGPVNAVFPLPLVALVRDANNNPVSGVTVLFNAPGSGASANPVSQVAMTGPNGLAQVNVTANTTLGTYNVAAAINGVVQQAQFVLTNHPGAQVAMDIYSGNGQSQLVTGDFAPLEVRVRDNWNNGVPNVWVHFSAPASGPSVIFVNGSSAKTGNTGIAQFWIRANAAPGTYNITATSAGLSPLTFTLTNVAFASHSIEVVDGTPQATNAGTAFPQPLRVRVRNQIGNPFQGATVTFTAPAGATAAISPVSAVTDASGIVSVTATANPTAGSYTVTAATPGVGGNAAFALQNIAVPTCTAGPVNYESTLPSAGALGPDMAMVNTWTAAFGFTVGSGESAIFAASQHSNYWAYPQASSVRMSISKCKGDFNVPAQCQNQGPAAYINLTGTANPAYWNYCQLEPNATYYFNVQQLQCNTGWCGMRGARY